MNCPNCGNHLSDTAKFCTKCGFKISAQGRPPVSPANIRNGYGGNAGMQQPAPAPKKKSGAVTVLIVIFAILLAAGIGGGVLYATGVLDGLTGGADSYAREERSRRDDEEEEETEEETEEESGSDSEAAADAETNGQLPVFVPVTGAASGETAAIAAETAPAAAETAAGTSGAPAVPSYVYTPAQPSQAQNNTYQPQNNTYQPQNNTYQPQNNTYQPQNNTYQPQNNAYQPSFGTGYAGAGANTGASSGNYSGAYSGGAYGGYAGNGDYILPQSSSVPLTSADLYGLSKDQLRLARNEIYARHGRMFNDQSLQAYFNSKSWYRGTIAPSSFRDDAMLTKLERDNIKLIQSFE